MQGHGDQRADCEALPAAHRRRRRRSAMIISEPVTILCVIVEPSFAAGFKGQGIPPGIAARGRSLLAAAEPARAALVLGDAGVVIGERKSGHRVLGNTNSPRRRTATAESWKAASPRWCR